MAGLRSSRLLCLFVYLALVISISLCVSCKSEDETRQTQDAVKGKPVDEAQQSRRVAIPKTEIDLNKKVALIIGNSEYLSSPNIPPLKNPENDARAMADVLRDLGFDVIVKYDLSRDGTILALDEFHEQIIDGAAIALFYYSGHGIQYKGENYMIPVTAKIESYGHIERYGVNFQELISKFEDADTQTNILIFDACRNIPEFQKTRSVGGNDNVGLAQISTTGASFIAYSTSPGEVALDGFGNHSPFTEELLRWIKEPGLTIEQVFKRVRRDVMRKTDNDQRPWDLSSLVEEFYFIPPGESDTPTVATDNFDEAYKYFSIGMGQVENKQYMEAIGTFSKVIDISPDFAEAYKERGTLYIRNRQFNESIDDLNRAIELKPDYAAAYNNKGIVYSMLGEYETAMNNFGKALEIDPGFLKSYNNKARLYQIKGEYSAALDVYAKALEINPHYAPAYNNRGLLYFDRKEYQKAIDDYTKAIESDAAYADAYHNRGVAYYYLNMNDKALEDYSEAILINPQYFEAYRDRAHLYEEMGLDDKAQADREIALQLSRDQ